MSRRGLPFPADEFDALRDAGKLNPDDVDFDAPSPLLIRARSALIVTAVLSLILLFFLVLTTVFVQAIAPPTDTVPITLLWFSVMQFVLDLVVVLLMIPAINLPYDGYALSVLAWVDLFFEWIQIIWRVMRIYFNPGCMMSCQFFEYLLLFFSVFFFVLAISYAAGTVGYARLEDARDQQSRYLLTLVSSSQPLSITTTTPPLTEDLELTESTRRMEPTLRHRIAQTNKSNNGLTF